MNVLKYTVIKDKKQYFEYCNILEVLVTEKTPKKLIKDEIDLLQLLIQNWDNSHTTIKGVDPIQLLKYLLSENNIKPIELAEKLFITRAMVSDLLNYKKGLSKDVIRKLSEMFKVSQEAFNRPYNLINSTFFIKNNNPDPVKKIKTLV